MHRIPRTGRLAVAAAALVLCSAAPAKQNIGGIPYTQTAGENAVGRQTLDLHLPSDVVRRPPLIAFVNSASWSVSQQPGVLEAAARTLVADGVAVALVRCRLAPADPLPAAVQDVVQALAWLQRSAARFGYDPQRIVLAGLGAGGQIAALAALDGGLPPSLPAGVIAVGAPLDLERWASQSPRHARIAAEAVGARPLADLSPINRVRPGAPPFLVLSAAREPRYQQVGARAFVEALRQSGNDDATWLSVPERDFFSVLQLDDGNPATALIAGFARGAFEPELDARLAARRAWRRPPFSTEGFWRHAAIVRKYPTDQRFYQALLNVMSGEREQLNGWPLQRYFAIDLSDYLDALVKEGADEGAWVVITNVNGERIVWRRSEILRYGPRIVIGLDGERNLFRLASFYRMRVEYSWKAGPPPPLMVRPLGAFIYFAEDRPERLRETIAGVAPAGIELAAADPLAALNSVPSNLRAVLTDRHNCVSCHDFRGTGARAHHLTAVGAREHGGYALPLASYPEPVLRRFLFDQEALARDFGITANVLARRDAEALYDLLTVGDAP